MPEAPRRRIDATTLRGLAHPLRVQLYDALVTYGPATATMLAARFGESTGSTSYHLRQLAKHGFVEEDPQRGAGRERYWRAYPGGSELDSYELAGGASGEAARLVVDEFQRAQTARLEHWLTTGYLQVPREWGQATVNSTSHLRLLPEELARLGAELTAVVDAWHERVAGRDDADAPDDDAGARIVEVQVRTFPVAAQDVP
ncbi:ArsR/SmtB family transcription factor [Jiangella rhizosphaerae]|uniref:ArsR family transcriptional regulator n=1 Tax=Jiangella rhizosphaerae TaxID=2293569 RepID=A0A418KPB9_9ACTN|nr:helix-turn-helix domain-containing protein [Jiangella rhizosphaerae]RIQ21230.1 ArsR family transcriptional regulator [Jiangella rhizosphaerae]